MGIGLVQEDSIKKRIAALSSEQLEDSGAKIKLGR